MILLKNIMKKNKVFLNIFKEIENEYNSCLYEYQISQKNSNILNVFYINYRMK